MIQQKKSLGKELQLPITMLVFLARIMDDSCFCKMHIGNLFKNCRYALTYLNQMHNGGEYSCSDMKRPLKTRS